MLGIAEGTTMDHRRSKLAFAWPWMLATLVAVAPARAQEAPAVKELLNRAQSKSQMQAVEDLIRRLKGSDGKPADKATAPAEKPAVPAQPPAAKTDTAKAEPSPVAKPSSQPGPVERTEPAAPVQPSPAAPAPPPAVAIAPPPAPAAPPPTIATLPPLPQPPPLPAIAPPPAVTPAPKVAVAEPLPSVDLEVQFKYRSAVLTPEATELLVTLGRALTDERLAKQTFLVAGHTDGRGSDAYNMELSVARAETVRAFLVQHFSIAPERLRTEGHGFRQLKNARNPYARENRRVQVTNITQQTARP